MTSHAHAWEQVWSDGNTQLQRCAVPDCPGRRIVGIQPQFMPVPTANLWQRRWLEGGALPAAGSVTTR